MGKRLRDLGILNKRNRPFSYSSLYSDKRRAIGLLANPIYVGKPMWGRTTQPLDPRTDARVPMLRPVAERITFEDEALRIVPDDLWRAAQARLDAIHAETARRRERLGNGAGPGRRGEYVLSGQLRCGCCKATYVIVRHDGVYGCSTRRHDQDACRHDRKISRTVLEDAIFKAIEDTLFDDAECDRILATLDASWPRSSVDWTSAGRFWPACASWRATTWRRPARRCRASSAAPSCFTSRVAVSYGRDQGPHRGAAGGVRGAARSNGPIAEAIGPLETPRANGSIAGAFVIIP